MSLIYTFPVGGAVVTLTVSGEQLTAADFDALIEFIQFAKKQLERKLQISVPKRPMPEIRTFDLSRPISDSERAERQVKLLKEIQDNMEKNENAKHHTEPPGSASVSPS